MVDHHGTPLAVCLTGANRHDGIVFEALVDAIPPIKRPSGQRRRRPAELHAAKAHDIPRCRAFLRRRRIQDHEAFLTLGCALLCVNANDRLC